MLPARLPIPLLEGAEKFRVSVDPGLCLHEATTLGTALALLYERRTRLACIITLPSDLRGDLATSYCTPSILDSTYEHVAHTSLDLGGVHDRPVLGPGGYWT